MAAKTQQERKLGTILLERWEQVARKIESLAQELPADKLEWRPNAGVRTCGEVLRHVAFWNQYVADSLRGKQANESLNELPVTNYATKSKVVDALVRTAQDAATALREQSDTLSPKSAELVVSFLEHTSEHYGQMAVYSRLLGVVPPASRS
jgi:uncharacterized damage-inducible protein DinB